MILGKYAHIEFLKESGTNFLKKFVRKCVKNHFMRVMFKGNFGKVPELYEIYGENHENIQYKRTHFHRLRFFIQNGQLQRVGSE